LYTKRGISMKNNAYIQISDRLTFQTLMVMEQGLGPKLFGLFRPFKKRFLQRLEQKLKQTPVLSREVLDSVEEITPEEFNEKYFSSSTPVVIRNAAKNWPCCQKWNLEFLKRGHGQEELLIVNAEGLTSRDKNADFEFLSLGQLVDNIKSGGKKYLRFSPLLEKKDDLAKDLDMNWLQRMKGSKTFAKTYYMFVGGPGQKTLLHTDQPCNLYVQVSGKKKWTLFSPKDSCCLYPEILNTAYVKSPIDVDSPDEKKFPLFKYARGFEVVLNPGDVLYVPPHTWHFVENLDETIAVGFRYSSLKAALKASWSFTMLRILSTNPPIWKTMEYGKKDTNLIWAHAGGSIKEVMKEWSFREKLKKTSDVEK